MIDLTSPLGGCDGVATGGAIGAAGGAVICGGASSWRIGKFGRAAGTAGSASPE